MYKQTKKVTEYFRKHYEGSFEAEIRKLSAYFHIMLMYKAHSQPTTPHSFVDLVKK